MAMRRTAAERDAKWSHLAEVTHGQLCVVVFGNRQQSDFMTELSEWINSPNTKKVALAVCQHLKATKPEASSAWTYTTTWPFLRRSTSSCNAFLPLKSTTK